MVEDWVALAKLRECTVRWRKGRGFCICAWDGHRCGMVADVFDSDVHEQEGLRDVQ